MEVPRMKPSLLPMVMLVATAPAFASPIDLTYVARSNIVTTLDPTAPIYAAPPGIGYDGVAGLLISKPTGTSLCTGALYGADHSRVVTAAHCLQNATSIDVVLFPSAGGTQLITSTSYAIKPGYTGAVIDPNDIGYISLGTSVNVVESYSFFSGDAVGQEFDEVGFGRSGTGATGATLPAGLRRHGLNRFDFTGADPVFAGFWGGLDILFADFDSGLQANDASCQLVADLTGVVNNPYCDLGLGDNEALRAAGGDSGAPLFVSGQIAAIDSFGLTFGITLGDVDSSLNSSFGEFGGYVPIAAHVPWLQAEAVPEPATIVLMLTGLLGIAMARRQRSSRAVQPMVDRP
jgi:hypothetical protein